jgi:hypothetical protein
VRKIPFRENQPLQVIDFVETKFAILIVFEFFLMTTEDTEGEFKIKNLCVLCTSAVNPAFPSYGRGFAR